MAAALTGGGNLMEFREMTVFLHRQNRISTAILN